MEGDKVVCGTVDGGPDVGATVIKGELVDGRAVVGTVVGEKVVCETVEGGKDVSTTVVEGNVVAVIGDAVRVAVAIGTYVGGAVVGGPVLSKEKVIGAIPRGTLVKGIVVGGKVMIVVGGSLVEGGFSVGA